MTHMARQQTARRWYFNKRPAAGLEPDTLVLREEPVPDLQPGEMLVRTVYMSLDATNRVWMSDWDIYMEPVHLGTPMRGFVVGEIVASRNDAFPAGAIAAGLHTWSDWFVTDGAGFVLWPDIEGLDLAEAFGILTVAGPTAYWGLVEIGQPKPGETVLVSAAAGAVGSLVGQIARLKGCRAVGIAGSDEKCRWLVEELGYDAAVNYRDGDLVAKLRAACPDGVDVLFENVGGDCLDAGLTVMNDFGRVVVCGLISTYNSTGPVPGPTMFRNTIMRRLRIQGFVILDHLDRYPEMQQALVGWMHAGDLKYRLHIVDGLENAADALNLLYTGGNNGKLMVRVGPDPKSTPR